MSISYFVRYQNLGAVLDAFDDYYCRRHAEILSEFPGIRSLVVHRPVPAADPLATHADPTDFLAQMRFDTADDLAAALQSEARQRARHDFANLPRAEGPVTHQAMSTRRIF